VLLGANTDAKIAESVQMDFQELDKDSTKKMSSTALDGATVLDAVFRNRNDLFLKCCPGIINFCISSCRLKTSTTQTPKRAQRARWRVQK